MSRHPFRILSLVAIAATVAACSRTQSAPKVPLAAAGADTTARDALPAAAVTALDLGNAEFRAGRYAQALIAYRDAARAAPDNAAPHFGIYMTAKKIGDTRLADSASKEIASRNGASLMLSDSAMRALHAQRK
jgi:hypothetical protein